MRFAPSERKCSAPLIPVYFGGARYILWQVPQLPVTFGHSALKLGSSLIAAAADAASAPSLAKMASKSAFFSQMAGRAAVSPPVFESSGNRLGPFLADSWSDFSEA